VAKPSIVVTLAPSCMTASARQELIRRPFTSTVHAPHWPWSQPFLVPVRSRRSRSASSSVVQGASVSLRSTPLTVSVTGIFSGTAMLSPLAVLVFAIFYFPPGVSTRCNEQPAYRFRRLSQGSSRSLSALHQIGLRQIALTWAILRQPDSDAFNVT